MVLYCPPQLIPHALLTLHLMSAQNQADALSWVQFHQNCCNHVSPLLFTWQRSIDVQTRCPLKLAIMSREPNSHRRFRQCQYPVQLSKAKSSFETHNDQPTWPMLNSQSPVFLWTVGYQACTPWSETCLMSKTAHSQWHCLLMKCRPATGRLSLVCLTFSFTAGLSPEPHKKGILQLKQHSILSSVARHLALFHSIKRLYGPVHFSAYIYLYKTNSC